MTAPPLLAVEGLRVAYGAAVAVRDISFTVDEGRIVVLLGANGAGKTTTVKAVAGLLAPSAGHVRLAGEDVAGEESPALVRRGISLVPEGRHVFPRMTVEENLQMGAHNGRGAANRARNRDRVFALFPRLAERRRQLGGSMSGGEQQMLAIARGLMAEPRLLILDEPSLGLAPRLVAELFTLIRRLNGEGVTVLLVEQNVRQSLQLADHAYVLEKGRVVQSGPGPALLADPRVTQAYLGAS
ncbi:MAG: ABC transporter ATP-binding protein [Reyranellaceae bacterium]